MFPQDQLAEILAAPFFAALNPQTLEALLPELQLTRLPGGEVLFHAGAAGDAMFVVLSGRLRVTVPHVNGAETIREIARGESVGELALLTGEARSATIRAIRDTYLARLSRQGFEQAIQADPTLLHQITVQLASRHRQSSNGELRSNIRTVSVLPAGTSTANQEFCLRLSKELTNFGPTVHINRTVLKQEFGFDFSTANTEPENESQLATWLDGLETEYRAMVYEADSDLNPWTRRCIRQADLILVVATVGSVSPEP
ncbi:MAG TPA: cyclic nucleotide-binding domain-containing protein, partial [Candidatus Binatia bacterium]